jgi:hypothetical protein
MKNGMKVSTFRDTTPCSPVTSSACVELHADLFLTHANHKHFYYCLFSFLLVSWGGVRLSPLGTSATNWPIVPAPDDR